MVWECKFHKRYLSFRVSRTLITYANMRVKALMENSKEGDRGWQQRNTEETGINRNGKMKKHIKKEEEKKKTIIKDRTEFFLLTPWSLKGLNEEAVPCCYRLDPWKKVSYWTDCEVLPKKREVKSYKIQDLISCQRKILKTCSGNTAN